MKSKILKIIFLFMVIIFGQTTTNAVEFKLLVLPTNIFSVCANYFCFPEVSEIVANDVVNNFKNYKGISAPDLYYVRAQLDSNPTLKSKTENVLTQFAYNDKVDFNTLQEISNAFGAKSVLIIDSYAINDKANKKQNLWEMLEISSAFQIRYPLYLKTNAILTDNVNHLIMWSGKYSKDVTNSDGYFSALGQIQAYSQLEKVKQYSKTNVAQNISQSVFTRFFPRDVRTFYINKNSDSQEKPSSNFMPNALEHLSNPHMQKEFEKFNFETQNTVDDYIFEF